MSNSYDGAVDYSDLVSVIIPTYKRSLSFVERAITSVLKQTYEQLEVIVIDDSPADYSERETIRDYVNSLNCDNVIYRQNETNVGGAVSRNCGIKIARGTYITFLDDDDEYLPMKVEKQVAFMHEMGCDLSFSNMKMYDANDKVVDVREYKDISSFDNSDLLKYHLMHHLTGTPTYMFKAEKLREINGFEDVPIMQEYMLMLKCIKGGLSIRYFDSCDVKIYKHEEGGITQGKRKIDAENRLYEMKKEYFSLLTKKEQKYISFRHWMVMAVAYKRNRKYLKIPISVMRAFMASPAIFCSEGIGFVRRIGSANKQKND